MITFSIFSLGARPLPEAHDHAINAARYECAAYSKRFRSLLEVASWASRTDHARKTLFEGCAKGLWSIFHIG